MRSPPESFSCIAVICTQAESPETISGSLLMVIAGSFMSLDQPVMPFSKFVVNMTSGSAAMFLSLGYCAARPCSVLSVDGVCAVAHDAAIVISMIVNNAVIMFIL